MNKQYNINDVYVWKCIDKVNNDVYFTEDILNYSKVLNDFLVSFNLKENEVEVKLYCKL